MKKIGLILISFLAIAAAAGPLTPAYAASNDGRYEDVTRTATTVTTSWTLLQGSTLRFAEYTIRERSGQLKIEEFCGVGNTYNAAAYYTTILPGEIQVDTVYKGTGGIWVRGNSVNAVVEFKSKRPASYWHWRP